jgi:iron(III) transport system ATP-binding protein
VSVLPEARNLGMVFQSYALWPHMTVFENVAYPLRSRGRRDISAPVRSVLELVGCDHLAKRYPGQLSGGQQQRVALARAVVGGQHVVLFDEPLSNVDAKVREQLRAELLAMQQRLGFAGLYVTHDQSEAMVLGSRIAVMRQGRIVQIDTPMGIYERPNSIYAAAFVGSANFLPGHLESGDGRRVTVNTSLGVIDVDAGTADLPIGPEVVVFFRPEQCQVDPPLHWRNRWRFRVEMSVYLGSYREHTLSRQGITLRVWTPGSLLLPTTDGEVWIGIDPKRAHVLAPEASS